MQFNDGGHDTPRFKLNQTVATNYTLFYNKPFRKMAAFLTNSITTKIFIVI
jgi:hypothetical protein